MRTRRLNLLAVFAIGLASASSAYANELGRLFFTPDQRAALDRVRFAPPPKEPEPKPVAVVAPPAVVPPPLPPVVMNGLVTRSSGRSTTWVNGVEQHDALRPAGASASVPIGTTNRRVQLKVGETFEPEANARYDVLRGGSIRVRPAE